MKNLFMLLAVCLSLALISGGAIAKPPTVIDSNKSMGETVYVSVAHMNLSYVQDIAEQKSVLQLIETKIYIRNTDPNNQITVTSVEIYDQDGNFLTDLINDPATLNSLASTKYGEPPSIPPNDKSIPGGFCALVTWQSDTYVNQPIISGAMGVSVPDGDGRRLSAFDSWLGQIIK